MKKLNIDRQTMASVFLVLCFTAMPFSKAAGDIHIEPTGSGPNTFGRPRPSEWLAPPLRIQTHRGPNILARTMPDNEKALNITVTRPHYRDTIYASRPISNLEGEISIYCDEIERVTITLTAVSDAKKIKTVTLPVYKWNHWFSMDVGNIDIGEYSLTATAYSVQGDFIGQEEKVVRKLAPGSPESIIGEDKTLLVNGVPFFPIGLWVSASVSDEFIENASAAGFNSFVTAPSTSILDKASRHGMKIIGRMRHRAAPLDPASLPAWRQAVAAWMEPIAEHQALVAYIHIDEPLWHFSQPLAAILKSYEIHRELDPYRPVWINFAPRNTVQALSEYTVACDIAGADIYPVPPDSKHSEKDDRTVSSVGKYTLKMRRTVNDHKPIWMVLQAFSWENFWNISQGNPVSGTAIYPTWEETRFMAYDAIIHGAKAITYWGINYIRCDQFRDSLYRIAGELSLFAAVFTSKTIDPSPVEVDNRQVAFIHKRKAGENYIFAANTGGQSIDVTFSGSFENDVVKIQNHDLEPRIIKIEEGEFLASLAPHEIHIYRYNGGPEDDQNAE